MCKSKDCQHGKESPIRAIVCGVNDMATTHPDLAKELVGDATKVSAGTHKKLRWRCWRSHEWEAIGKNRAKGNGCPICAGKMILAGFNDLATTHPALALECQVDPSMVLSGTHKIIPWKCKEGHKFTARCSSRTRDGNGCPVCACQIVAAGINDMATTRPDLARECLDDPSIFAACTGKVLRWRCVKGHEYKSTGANRFNGKGCPYCACRKVLPGFNDMATTHPNLAKELMGDPTKIVAGTNSRLKWKCGTCEFEWSTAGCDRVNGRGCSKCANYGHDQSQPSFIYLVYRPGQIKYGIMNTWTGRLKNHARKGWELLDKIETTGRSARSLETTIKQALRANDVPTGSKAFRKKFDGWNETFQEMDLCVRSIRGLCRKLGINLEAFLAA